MDELPTNARIEKLLRQQSALAGFGSFAFREDDLKKILTEASRICAESLGAPFAKVCQYRETTNDLLIVAGYGWKTGVVGHVVSRADESSPQGRAFVTGEPVISELVREANFALPPFYAEHGVVSTIDVIIKGNGQPFGILEIDSVKQQDYDQQDVVFLTGFANVLAEAVGTSRRTEVLRATIARMKALVEEKETLLEEKNRLLEEKNVLAVEVQHRVRNNLQLVYGMLSRQLDELAEGDAKEGIKGIARRVMTLAQVYDHLLGSGMSRTINFGEYLKSLCQSLVEIQGEEKADIRLACRADVVVLDLDSVTALGIIVAEVVSNSYGHAFPGRSGTITVELHRSAQDGEATLTVGDDGIGFAAAGGKSKRHGLGLVKRLAEQIGGHIALDAEGGTTWTIRFPSAATEAVEPKHPVRVASAS
jgi:two-component sensor histidine kinase